MPKLNLSELEELGKKAFETWKPEHAIIYDETSPEEERFFTTLIEAFPSLSRTIRCYEQAIERVKEMAKKDGIDLKNSSGDGVDVFWRVQRECILADLDKALKEIE